MFMCYSQKPVEQFIKQRLYFHKADKTSNDSVKNSPGISTAKQRAYLSPPTLPDNQDEDDSTF